MLHCQGRGFLNPGEDMAVCISSDRDVAVPQAFANYLEMHSRSQRKSGMGMAKAVEGQVRKPSFSDDLGKFPGDIIGVNWGPISLREHIPKILP